VYRPPRIPNSDTIRVVLRDSNEDTFDYKIPDGDPQLWITVEEYMTRSHGGDLLCSYVAPRGPHKRSVLWRSCGSCSSRFQCWYHNKRSS
jgi:hypothetical protein